jgi:DNA-binding LacI/PurR family transcriptional regulator/DNA-binding CsgD family transcriptional regulator
MRDQSIPVFYDEKSAASTQYSSTIQGIRSAASRYGMHLMLVNEKALDGVDFDSLPQVAILTGASMPFLQRVIARLRAGARRAVLAGSDSEQFGHDVSCATPSRRAETQQLVNYLYNCGKQRIALVGFGRNSINDNFRYHAAMSAVAARGSILTEGDVWLWQHDPRSSFEAFLDVSGRYDAAICSNDIMAICLINACALRGLRVPEDLFVASFGNMTIGRFYRPSITSMTMDMHYVGVQAFQAWRFLMNNEDAPQTALKITVPSQILARQSTANLNAEARESAFLPSLEADRFYENPTIAKLVEIEHCISRRDAIDMDIIKFLMDGLIYERIAEKLFISGSTLRYRLKKIFTDAGVSGRQEFRALINKHLGEGNPFKGVDLDAPS